MGEAKRKRLMATGWKIGTTADFLELTPEESAHVELRLKVADGLKRRRKQKRLIQVRSPQPSYSTPANRGSPR